MQDFTFKNEESNLISSMNDYDEESNSSIILFKPSGEKIYFPKDNTKTIKDNENLNDNKIKIGVYNNIINDTLFDKENSSFIYNNSINIGLKNIDNYKNYLNNNETNENSNKNTGSNNSENFEKTELKASSSNNINQIDDRVNNIEKKKKKKVFLYQKRNEKKYK